jgi:hypothetical protein
MVEMVKGIFTKKEVDYHKLYDQEKKKATSLNKKLENIYGAIVNAASEVRSTRLRQFFQKDYGQDNAPQAVQALLAEYKLCVREIARLGGALEKSRKTNQDLEAEREKANEDRAIEVSKLENEKEHLKANHEDELAHVKAELRGEINRLNAVISQREREHNYKLEQVKHDHQEKINEMQMEFTIEKSQLQTDHADQQGRLKKDIEALNGALVKREHFKPLSDNDLKMQFSDLATDIDHVARLGWKYNQTDWTDELLSQSKNPRKVKKNIMLEFLWTVLYENIFCSPFRVVGDEGRSLETEWNVAFGRGRYSSRRY